MSFPTVSGIVIDTDDETSRSPMAIPSGFLSGFASATIERKDDALFVASPPADGSRRENMDRFGVACGFGGVVKVRSISSWSSLRVDSSLLEIFRSLVDQRICGRA